MNAKHTTCCLQYKTILLPWPKCGNPLLKLWWLVGLIFIWAQRVRLWALTMVLLWNIMHPPYRFMAISTGIIYWYYTYLLKVDEEEYGGHGALLQEGLFASFTLFLLSWTLVYSLAHFWEAPLAHIPLFTVPDRKDSPGQCRLRSILERALYQNGSEL